MVSSKEHELLALLYHLVPYHLADCRETLESIKNVEACLGISLEFLLKILFFVYATNLDFLLHHGTPLYLCCTPDFAYMQGMVLCILKINGMLKMQSASFTATVLDMRNAAYGSNGGGVKSAAGMMMGHIRSLQRHCLSATSTPLKQKRSTLKSILNLMVKSSTYVSGAATHLFSLQLKKMLQKPLKRLKEAK